MRVPVAVAQTFELIPQFWILKLKSVSPNIKVKGIEGSAVFIDYGVHLQEIKLSLIRFTSK